MYLSTFFTPVTLYKVVYLSKILTFRGMLIDSAVGCQNYIQTLHNSIIYHITVFVSFCIFLLTACEPHGAITSQVTATLSPCYRTYSRSLSLCLSLSPPPHFAAMYIIFRGVETKIFYSPLESMMGMFIMSLGEFADIYDSFSATSVVPVPKVMALAHSIYSSRCTQEI